MKRTLSVDKDKYAAIEQFVLIKFPNINMIFVKEFFWAHNEKTMVMILHLCRHGCVKHQIDYRQEALLL